ncbi:MAG: hypothetical protein AABX89_00135 [Candidatus Thermoplasmatota archaeon]
MDPLVGALVASAVAWLSIVAAAVFPVRMDLGLLRLLGAISIALLGLAAFGLPVPGWLSLAVLAAGIVAALAAPRMRRETGKGFVP